MSNKWLNGCLAFALVLLALGAAGAALYFSGFWPEPPTEGPGEAAAEKEPWQRDAEAVAASRFWRARVSPAVVLAMAKEVRGQKPGAVVFIDDRGKLVIDPDLGKHPFWRPARKKGLIPDKPKDIDKRFFIIDLSDLPARPSVETVLEAMKAAVDAQPLPD
jgi:hypothetical protein